MGEYKTHREPDEVRLQRESEELLTELKAKLNELDRARARAKARHASPEQRRRSFRLIQGGAAVAGVALAWGWEMVRRPAVAVSAVSGTVATSAILAAPMVAPGTAGAEPPPPAVVTIAPDADQPVKTRPPVTPIVERVGEVTVTPSPSPTVTAPPTAQPQQPATTPTPMPSPTPTPTVSVTPLPSPTATVDVKALCLEAGLPPTASVAACLEHLELGLDVGL